MPPKAILFDLDDTIISFDSHTKQTWEKICKDFTEKYNLFPYKKLFNSINEIASWYWSDEERHRIGRLNPKQTRRNIVISALEKLNCNDIKFGMEIADNYSDLHEKMITLFPNALETIQKFSKMGIKLGLLTNGNSKMQNAKINKFNLASYFEICLVEEELGFGKPDKRVFKIALEKLNVKSKDAWMVGDNLIWDIQGAQASGIFAIWNDFANKGLPENSKIIPDRIINNISELL